ncbi:glycerol dehydrogenase [Azotobacter vinelandii CA]|uniref:Glycerol dehydrogenase n=2 Tax=Azotobacter vinelandii TaxID=354 RepID=C1DE29_AZOVD|nr:glycerol dehydrogenase [Azotobacter vinelandii]ACO80137.1 glycerol dehydrogenase [Azotobacter vinelandii DJ]AGK14475.1 glycerol dehydrogenase [Azotobacter vinelandii CA]AGK21724.1 glycerol dehydrogenase [Azotobacter vinelandii CA6]SFX20479.1 glycerol 2-dehydrogenase (NAD+) [Azotobacter vinelandii]GLK62062.1 glycerol dehydrogenase [Azotobacter vinelandii]
MMPNGAISIRPPGKFFIGKGLLAELGSYAQAFGNRAYVICDKFILERAIAEAGPSFGERGSAVFGKFRHECTRIEINRNREMARSVKAELIVGIGGGKTLDTAKAVACHERLPVLTVPTTASSDAACTARALIYTLSSEFDRCMLLPSAPDLVLADTEILAAAPARLFVAGIGKALATYFEVRACYRAQAERRVPPRAARTALASARLCLDSLLENAVQARLDVERQRSSRALEAVLEATVYLSGVSADGGGRAAAHAIHNGMLAVPALQQARHGEKMAFALLAQLVLERAPQEEIATLLDFSRAVGLPLGLRELGVRTFAEAQWRRVAERACEKRESMGNMPFAVAPDDVYRAIREADALADEHRTASERPPLAVAGG